MLPEDPLLCKQELALYFISIKINRVTSLILYYFKVNFNNISNVY
jgi:hypothetical protein